MLQEKDRKKLDSIVQQMITNQEPDNNIQAVVADFKSKYDKTSKQTGFIQSMAQGMAKPFLTAAATGASAVKGITGAIGAGISSLAGNKDYAQTQLREAAKPVNINAGYFGTGEAIGGKGESTADVVKKSVGTGLELGSWMVGGSGAKSAITQSLKQKVGQGALQGLKTGAAAGSLTGTGVEMQKDDSTTGDIIGAGLGGGLIGGSVGAVAGGATPIIAKGARSIFPKSQARQLAIKMEKLDQTIDEGVSKGIKPTVIGKKTLANNDKFYSNARIAVKTIAENRSKINVFDDLGEKVSHPKSNAQAAQAIDQAKKIIYNEYHKMATDAGDMGAVFNDIPIINKLQKVSADLKFSPKVRQYAASMVDEISELKGQAPDVIEARIAELNESLKSYYAGTRIDKAKAQVDASVAKAMREQLDNIIEAAGDGYKELKMQYGALKSIENEVNKRALVLARQGGKSLIDFTDIFTGGDLVSGLLTGNPAVLARGIAGKGIAAAYKKINDPDRYIEKMFKEAYKVIPETSISTVPFASSAGMAGKNVNLAPKPVSPQNTGLLENQNRNLLNVNPAVKSIAAPIKNPIAPNTAPAQSVKATNVNPQSQLGIGRKNETIKTGTGKNIPTSKAIVQNAGQKSDVINKPIIRKKNTINQSKSQVDNLIWARGTRAAGIQNAGLKNYNLATKALEKAGELPSEIKSDKITKDFIKNYYETKKPPVVGDVFINGRGEKIEITKIKDNVVDYFLKGKKKGIFGSIYADNKFLKPKEIKPATSGLPELGKAKTGTPIYRGQSQKGEVSFNETRFLGNTDGGVFFTKDKKTAEKYGGNIIKNISTEKNTVSVKESDKLQKMASEQVEKDLKNMVESDELIEQMALGRPKAFAEYTKKPFIETGDKFGEPGELIYYKELDKTPAKGGLPELGKAKTYYHQSQSQTPFIEFKQKGDVGYKKAYYSQANEGIYFSTSKDLVSSKYGKNGGQIIEANITPKKSLDLGNYDAMYFDGRKVNYGDIVSQNFKREIQGLKPFPEPDIILTGITKKAKLWLQEKGYDAVEGMKGEMYSAPEIVVLDKSIINVNPAVKSIAAPIKNPIAPNTAPAQSVKATNVNPQSQLGIGRKNETIKTGTGKNIPTSKAIVQNAGQKSDVINKPIIRKKNTINQSKSQAAARKYKTVEEITEDIKSLILQQGKLASQGKWDELSNLEKQINKLEKLRNNLKETKIDYSEIPLYHGTQSDVFTKFDLKQPSSNTQTAMRGVYFFTKKEPAMNEYGKNIIEAKAKIKNPLIVDGDRGWNSLDFQREIEKAEKGLATSLDDYIISGSPKRYDAIIIKNANSGYGYGYGNGFDEVIIPANKVNNITTKSQLIDTWNQANKKKRINLAPRNK